MDTCFWCPRAKTGGPAAGVGRHFALIKASDDRWPGGALFGTPGGVECERLPIGSTLGRLPCCQTIRKRQATSMPVAGARGFGAIDSGIEVAVLVEVSFMLWRGFSYPGSGPKPRMAPVERWPFSIGLWLALSEAAGRAADGRPRHEVCRPHGLTRSGRGRLYV